MKWLIGTAVVLVMLVSAALVVAAGKGGSEEPQAQVLEKPENSKPTPPQGKKPSTFRQVYETTLFYRDRNLLLRWFDVTNLDRNTATVKYRATLFGKSGENLEWVKDKRRWNLRAPNQHQGPSTLKTSRSGNRVTIEVAFRWPTELLLEGSGLEIQFPPSASAPTPARVMVNLEVPTNSKEVRQRYGAAGLR